MSMLIFQLLLQTGSCYTFPAGTEKLEQQVLIFHRKDKNTQKSYQFSDFTQRSTMQNRCIPIRRISLVDVAGVRVKLWLVYIYMVVVFTVWPMANSYSQGAIFDPICNNQRFFNWFRNFRCNWHFAIFMAAVWPYAYIYTFLFLVWPH